MKMPHLLLGLAAAAALAGPAGADDWPAVAKALGKEGAVQAGGVYRVGLPRSDLHVVLDGVVLKPTLALGSWVAFREEAPGHAMVMGDLVLLPAEVNPVLTELEAGGINVTAIHNHLLRAAPMTFYMHIDGHGDPVKLAGAIHAALVRSKTPLGAAAAAKPEPMNLDTAKLDAIMGAKGKAAGPVWQYGLPRAEAVHAGGMEVGAPMGSAEAINFQGLPGGQAATTGDFVLTADEVNPVIQALRAHNIEVTALHNHMLDDEPRLFFMHFWGKGNAETLASGLRAALDRVKIAGR